MKRLFPNLLSMLSGAGLKALALRGSIFSMSGVVGTNLLRLGSNLILTRILFPEAFGLMALVQVFTSGLQMFSDIGIVTSIKQSKRGDDPDFLNMAWTLQIIRGVLLWLGACALAWPVASLYEEPMLAQLLPVVGLNAIISSFETTNVPSASRHLRLGRQTVIRLGSRVFGIAIIVFLAWLWESVWALAIGGLIGGALKMILLYVFMPGIKNRLHWDRSSLSELIGFGKYIFLSTVAGFMINQGDRALLGNYITTAELGIYNVGFLIGTIPLLVCKTIANKVLLPLYRMKPPIESARNRAQIFKARRLVVLVGCFMCVILAYGGVPLIETLYDPRYSLAGPMVVLFGLAAIPQVAFSGYDPALLANGDSKRFFVLLTTIAVFQIILLFLGIQWLGIFGAILAPGLAALFSYPLRTWFLRNYAANDNLGDAVFLLLGLGLTGLGCWLQWDEMLKLITVI